jgi:hypothetical protein
MNGLPFIALIRIPANGSLSRAGIAADFAYRLLPEEEPLDPAPELVEEPLLLLPCPESRWLHPTKANAKTNTINNFFILFPLSNYSRQGELPIGS